MADNPATQPSNSSEPGFPVAAIVCIAIGGYVVVILILVIIRQVLLQRGMCRENCSCCGKEGELQCCECCVSCAESANCCKSPNVQSCLDSICPARKQMDCVDIIMCECCTNQDGGCCGSQEPLCDGCNECCQEQCSDCECNTIHCCCFEISLKGGPQGQVPPNGGYPQYPYPQGGYAGAPYGGHGNIPPPQQGYYPGAGSDPYGARDRPRAGPGSAQPVAGYGNPAQMFSVQGPVRQPYEAQPASASPF